MEKEVHRKVNSYWKSKIVQHRKIIFLTSTLEYRSHPGNPTRWYVLQNPTRNSYRHQTNKSNWTLHSTDQQSRIQSKHCESNMPTVWWRGNHFPLSTVLPCSERGQIWWILLGSFPKNSTSMYQRMRFFCNMCLTQLCWTLKWSRNWSRVPRQTSLLLY